MNSSHGVRRASRRPLARALTTLWHQRRHFASTRDWLIRWLDGLFKRLPVLGRLSSGPVWHVRVTGYEEPLVVRKTSKDWVALRETIFEGEYDPFLEYLRPAPQTIVDLGSNIGMSLRFWMHHFPDARLLGVEPDPENVETCRLNVAAGHGGERVQLFETCVGASGGCAFLDRSGQPMEYRILANRTRGALPVVARTVGEILAESGFSRIGLLKCDIEGGELELFRDCASWIARVDLLVAELHPPYDLQRLVEDLRRGGVRPEPLRRIEKAGGVELVGVRMDRKLATTRDTGLP